MDFVFDLDGTLIDSAPAIRHCLTSATEAIAPECIARARTAPIGPPLTRTAEFILGDSYPGRLVDLVEAFMRTYDEDGVARTSEYPGASIALGTLVDGGARLAIVTNKREKPTTRILAALGWSGLFLEVLCTDSTGCGEMDKAARTAALLSRLRTSDCAMVGDTLEDYRAAASNGIGFVAADYGYEADRIAFRQVPAILRLTAPENLASLAGLRSIADREISATSIDR